MENKNYVRACVLSRVCLCGTPLQTARGSADPRPPSAPPPPVYFPTPINAALHISYVVKQMAAAGM